MQLALEVRSCDTGLGQSFERASLRSQSVECRNIVLRGEDKSVWPLSTHNEGVSDADALTRIPNGEQPKKRACPFRMRVVRARAHGSHYAGTQEQARATWNARVR